MTQVPYGDTYATLPDDPAERAFPSNLDLLDRLDGLTDAELEPDDPEPWHDPDSCCYCGEVLFDDMEVGQGYCSTAPCWMYATGQIELAQAWEATQRFMARHSKDVPNLDNSQAPFDPENTSETEAGTSETEEK